MIEELLPREVVSVAITGDDPSASLLPEEAAQFGWAVEARVQEFTTARTCARRALVRLGLPVTPILRGPKREPLWPSGVVGSITHCRGYRVAVVALQQKVLAIGIDAETNERLPTGVVDLVTLASERRWLTQASKDIHWDRLLFSAKESFFKTWHPLTGLYLDFQDVEVTFEREQRIFHARLGVSASKLIGREQSAFTGRFLVTDRLILTAVSEMK
jgi:4'-phosphopantetheinyl transferase EntD